MGTPSDHDYINVKAFERFVRAFDSALAGKYGFGFGTPNRNTVVCKEAMEQQEQYAQTHRLSFWLTFPPIKALRRLRDDIRLRKYNDEWLKNNIR